MTAAEAVVVLVTTAGQEEAETLSRILGKMSAQGCIATKGRTIELRDRRMLESLAAGERSLI